MIKSRKDLYEYLKTEKRLYVKKTGMKFIKSAFLREHDYLIWRYIKNLRYTEYYYNTEKKIPLLLRQRKLNKIGACLGFSIGYNTFDKGLKIWHYGSIAVNPKAKIGLNCQLHGENCIGNKGDFDSEAPKIGNNVDIGFGASIIGNIYIADNVRIGANAVVTKSCSTPGTILAGIPAKEIKTP